MALKRKDKLILLRSMVDLKTGAIDESAFDWENRLYEKAVLKKTLDRRIFNCDLCEDLNIKRCTDSCTGWGDLNAKVFFIGQSLHKLGILSDLPFILGSGYLLDAALRLSGLLRKDVFITNVVHCHPPRNRTSTEEEKKNCLGFLEKEIEIVWPELIVALGNDAQWAISTFGPDHIFWDDIFWDAIRVIRVKHPASFLHSAPEDSIEWIIKLSNEIDKVYK